MNNFKAMLLRGLLRTTVLLLTLTVFAVLSINGILRLFESLHLWLTELYGPVTAELVTGVLCVLPLILVLLFVWRLIRRLGKTASTAPRDSLRELVRANPWEAVGTAFLLGLSGNTDITTRSLVLYEALVQLGQRNLPDNDTPAKQDS